MRQTALQVTAVVLCVIALASALHRARSNEAMASTAKNFLASLTPEQKAKVSFSFEDAERLNWHFIPRERKGVAFKDMDGAQKMLAHAFLSAGLSQRGYLKANTIMSLDEVLRELEKDTTGRRNPEGYYFSVFGEPSETNTWGWRVEGHHLALNFTVVKGRLVASSPAFFGANPAEVRNGPRKGLRALEREEDLARELLNALDAKQKAVAVFDPKAPNDILSTNKQRADIGPPKGLLAAKMNKKQMEMLNALIEEYAATMPEDLAQARLDAVRKNGLDKVYFAWAGSPDRGQAHYYAVQGPTFLIEYDNTQNNANHIHSVWRDYNGDFGLDLLALHYQQSHQPKATKSDE